MDVTNLLDIHTREALIKMVIFALSRKNNTYE